MRIAALLLACAALAGCALPSPSALPGVPDPRNGPFIPVSDYPHPPNVENLIGPDDCRGATLRAVSADLPAYPPREYADGRQGWVVVRFNVLADGRVDDSRVARGVPGRGFNRAARRAVRNWLFEPLEGGAVLHNCVVMIEFRAGEVQIR